MNFLLFPYGVWYREKGERRVVYWTVLSVAEINIASVVDEALVEWYWGGEKQDYFRGAASSTL